MEIKVKPFKFYGDFCGRRKKVEVNYIEWNGESVIFKNENSARQIVPVWVFKGVQSEEDFEDLRKIYKWEEV